MDNSFGTGFVGGRGSNHDQNRNVVNNMKNQLNNGTLITCDTPPETTLCAKQHSSVDGLVQRSKRNMYFDI